jgi:hypothetical protein
MIVCTSVCTGEEEHYVCKENGNDHECLLFAEGDTISDDQIICMRKDGALICEQTITTPRRLRNSHQSVSVMIHHCDIQYEADNGFLRCIMYASSESVVPNVGDYPADAPKVVRCGPESMINVDRVVCMFVWYDPLADNYPCFSSVNNHYSEATTCYRDESPQHHEFVEEFAQCNSQQISIHQAHFCHIK